MKLIDKLIFTFGIIIFLIGIGVFIILSYIIINSPTYALSDLTPYAILLSALIAAIAMYLSTRMNIILDSKNQVTDAKNKQFEFMINLYNFYYAHEGIRSIRFAIEYDNFIYDDTTHGSDNEKYLFALLRFFENVCYMYHNKMLEENVIEPLLYDMKKVYTNDEVQKFLQVIKGRHEKYQTKRPYENFLKFSEHRFV